MLLPSTDLMRVCRESGLSEQEIRGLVNRLRPRATPAVERSFHRPAATTSPRPGSLATTMMALARTLRVSLR